MNLRYNMNAYPIIFYEKVSLMTSSYSSLLVNCYASEFLFLWPGCTIHLELVINHKQNSFCTLHCCL